MSLRDFKLLYAIRCKICRKEFIWTPHRRNDFRCPKCRDGVSVEAVEKELEEMDSEEYQAFMDEIKEYEKENGCVIILDDERD